MNHLILASMNQEYVVPQPILMNLWKHHAGYIRHRIETTIRDGPRAMKPLADEMIVIGSVLMDLYFGARSITAICQQLVAELEEQSLLESKTFVPWIQKNHGYRMWVLDDGSQWTLRASDDPDRPIHLHPGRWSPHTRRVRANVLKTAILTLVEAGIYHLNPLDVSVVNAVRATYLKLAPIPHLNSNEGLGEMIDLLA